MNKKLEILKFYHDSFIEKGFGEKCQIVLDSKEKINELVFILNQEQNNSAKDINILRADNVTMKPEIIERLFLKGVS